ncbi:MAG TPA: hypothetical protein PLO62_04545 [Candidatus Hydrogenedentes bacterium]|nr:hypothetical protein [Candidatus Hydrogenedentota bacterium]
MVVAKTKKAIAVATGITVVIIVCHFLWLALDVTNEVSADYDYYVGAFLLLLAWLLMPVLTVLVGLLSRKEVIVRFCRAQAILYAALFSFASVLGVMSLFETQAENGTSGNPLYLIAVPVTLPFLSLPLIVFFAASEVEKWGKARWGSAGKG